MAFSVHRIPLELAHNNLGNAVCLFKKRVCYKIVNAFAKILTYLYIYIYIYIYIGMHICTSLKERTYFMFYHIYSLCNAYCSCKTLDIHELLYVIFYLHRKIKTYKYIHIVYI